MTRLLRWFCDPDKLEAIEGDLAELYGDRRSWRYVIEVVSHIAIKPEGGIQWYPRHFSSR